MTNEDRIKRLETLTLSLYTNFLVFFDSMNGAKDPRANKNMLEAIKHDKETLTEIVHEMEGGSNEQSKN